MSDYPDGITHVVRLSGCRGCAGREYFAVSRAQAEEQIDALKETRDSKCTANYTIVKVA